MLHRPPRTGLERTLAGVFADVLHLSPDRVGVDDNFFELGGDSLSATGVVAGIRSALHVEAPIRMLFEAPTIAELAPRLADCGVARTPLTPRRRPDRIPLSYAQSRLWFIHRYEGPSPTYNIPMAARLTGRVDIDAMRAAFADVVGRHESLRTVFEESDGVAFQRILPVERTSLSLPVRAVTADEEQATVRAEARRPFDLSTDIPVRATLLQTGSDDHVLVLVLHHIAGDGASMVPLVRDMLLAYAARSAGTEPRWDPLPVQYADYTCGNGRCWGTRTRREASCTGSSPTGEKNSPGSRNAFLFRSTVPAPRCSPSAVAGGVHDSRGAAYRGRRPGRRARRHRVDGLPVGTRGTPAQARCGR